MATTSWTRCPQHRLPDGAVATLCDPDDPRYAGTLTVQLDAGHGPVDEVRIPFPEAGVERAHFVSSLGGDVLVLVLDSGDAAAGYEAFVRTPGLRRIGTLAYVPGEGAELAFAPGAERLLMTLPASVTRWWVCWDDVSAEVEADGHRTFDFGTVWVHDLRTGHLVVSLLRLRVGAAWQAEQQKPWAVTLQPRFVSPARIAFRLPWGDVDVDLPAGDPLVLDAPDGWGEQH